MLPRPRQPHAHAAKAEAFSKGQGGPHGHTANNHWHAIGPRLPQWALSQGQGTLPWACCQAQGSPMCTQLWLGQLYGHTAKAKVASCARSLSQGIQPPGPRHVCCQGQGSPTTMQLNQPHGYAAKANACMTPKPRHIPMGTLPRPTHARCPGRGSAIGTLPRPRHATPKAKPASLARNQGQGMQPRPSQPLWASCQGQGMQLLPRQPP